MTTTQPAALPELPRMPHELLHLMETERQAVRRYAESYALAAMQSQPAAESPCACWPGRMCSRSAQCARDAQPAAAAIAEAIHYPDCWDQMAYPTLESALHELTAWFKCSNDECKQPAAAGVSDAACVPEKPLGKNWHAHYVLLDKAALQMIRNALRNDVERGLKVRGEMLEELDRAILALRPQSAQQAVPMTEDEFVACLVKANCVGVVKMSYDSGPYDVTRPSINASKLKEAFEAHHGITAQGAQEGK